MTNDIPQCEYMHVHPDTVEKIKEIMPDDDHLIDLAELFKVFGDSTRIKILSALSGGEMCVCDISTLVGMTSSAVSHQLKALRLANLVKFRREAQIVYYSLADDHVKEIIDKGMEHLYE